MVILSITVTLHYTWGKCCTEKCPIINYIAFPNYMNVAPLFHFRKYKLIHISINNYILSTWVTFNFIYCKENRVPNRPYWSYFES